MSREKKNYQLIVIVQLVSALLVLALHAGRIFDNEVLHFIQKSILSRMAVPVFFISAAYFYRLKCEDNLLYSKHYFKQRFRQYLLWSLLYLPFGLMYLYKLGLPGIVYPFALVFGLLYSGVYYHLWFIPALLQGILIVNGLMRRFRLVPLMFFAGFLFILGSVETYSAYLEHTVVMDIYRVYAQIFFTSRNVIFYTLVFILIGFVLYDYREHPFLNRRLKGKVLISFGLLLIESFIVYQKQGIDKNFMLMMMPFSFFFMNLVLKSELKFNMNMDRLKFMSGIYYVMHPMILDWLQLNHELSGMLTFITTTILIYYLGLIMYQLKTEFIQVKSLTASFYTFIERLLSRFRVFES